MTTHRSSLPRASPPRRQQARTDATRQALIEAGRALFVAHGFADTSTPAIVDKAGVTRGALYHHFADKRDLFRAVLQHEAEAVATDIAEATPGTLSPQAALLAGSEAYLKSMRKPGRTRLLLIDGPAAVGLDEMVALDASNAAQALREGLADAMGGFVDESRVSLDALAALLSAAFDRAALEVDAGSSPEVVQSAMNWMLTRVTGR